MEIFSIIITNNPKVWESDYSNIGKIMIEERNIQEVLYYVRDKIHLGHKLLTHPLSGSLKPNENPFKSVMISREATNVDFEHVRIVENCIETTLKFMSCKELPQYIESTINDFMFVDKTIIESGMKKTEVH